MPLTTRSATRTDLPRLVDVYNHYVLTSHCTFDTELFSETARLPWFEQFDGSRYRCVVAEENGVILGYACTTPFKAKPAYGTSVEISVYVVPDVTRRGVGRTLYELLLPQLAGCDLHRVYAGIALPNDASIALHETFGFMKAAHFREVGYKFDRYWDVAWYELGV